MVTVAQTIKYLNTDALCSMRFAALLPTHTHTVVALLSLSHPLSV